MLAGKIIKGGNGNWGKNIMAAHPQHSEEEALEMVRYILSLSEATTKPMPLKGSVLTREHLKDKSQGYYVLRANYTDKGIPQTGPLTGRNMLTLRHPKVQAEDADILNDISTRHMDGTDMTFLANIQDGSFIAFKDIDLTGVRQIHFGASTRQSGSMIEVRIGGPRGKLLGKADVPRIENFSEGIKVTKTTISANAGQSDLYFVFRNNEGQKENILLIDWILFDNGEVKLP